MYRPTAKNIMPGTKFIVGVGGGNSIVWVSTNAETPERAAELAMKHYGYRRFILSIFRWIGNKYESISIPEGF